MKHKKVSILFSIIGILFIMGACVAEQITLEDNPTLSGKSQTRGVQNIDDNAIIAAQTDLYALLAKQVQYKDSVFSLAISQEEATILNIPDSIYNKFQEVIQLLNSTKK